MRKKRILMLIGSVCLAMMLLVPLAVSCGPATPEEAVEEIAALEAEIDELEGNVSAKDAEISDLEAEIAKLRGEEAPAPGEAYEWDVYTTAGQYTHWEEENLGVLAKEVEEFTNGRLKLKIFYAGEHPYGAFDLLKALSAGDCDMAEIPSYYTSGIEPALAAVNLPFLIPSWDVWIKVYQQMRNTYIKDILAEKWNSKELISGLWGPENFFLTDDFITDFESVKGRKLRSWCPETAHTIEMIGGEPITVAYAELYTALQTGLVDGFCTNTLSAMRGGLYEVCPYITVFNFAYGPCMFCVNLDSWNKLPPDLRDSVTGFLELKRDWFLTGILKDDGMTFLTEAINRYDMHVMAAPSEFRDECRTRSYEAIHKPWLERVSPTGVEAYNEIAKIVAEEGYPISGYEIK